MDPKERRLQSGFSGSWSCGIITAIRRGAYFFSFDPFSSCSLICFPIVSCVSKRARNETVHEPFVSSCKNEAWRNISSHSLLLLLLVQTNETTTATRIALHITSHIRCNFSPLIVPSFVLLPPRSRDVAYMMAKSRGRGMRTRWVGEEVDDRNSCRETERKGKNRTPFFPLSVFPFSHKHWLFSLPLILTFLDPYSLSFCKTKGSVEQNSSEDGRKWEKERKT